LNFLSGRGYSIGGKKKKKKKEKELEPDYRKIKQSFANPMEKEAD